MAWIYLQESEESQRLYPLGLNPSDTVISNCSHKPQSLVDSGSENYQEPLSVPTLEVLEAENFPKSTLSMEASHARTLALQGAVRAWKESEADYFSRSCALSLKFDRRLSSWKMSQLSLLEDLERSPQKLPKQGMIVGGLLYPLQKSERHIEEKGGGYLPTPTTCEGGRNKSASKGARIRPSLGMLAKMFPTPDASTRGPTKTYDPAAKSQSGRTLQSFVAAFPTPTVCGNNNRKGSSAKAGDGLATVAGGSLNPTWVEWLMGYRLGWTELNASVMPWFLSKRGKRLKS